MVTLAMCRTAERLKHEGWTELCLPIGENTPIPGLILFANERHQLLRVMPDGGTVDLIKLQHERGRR